MNFLPRVQIDPNVRTEGNGTYAGFEDVRGVLALGVEVILYEPESMIEGVGRVTRLDVEAGIVYLDVDWSSFHDVELNPAPVASVVISGGVDLRPTRRTQSLVTSVVTTVAATVARAAPVFRKQYDIGPNMRVC
jgi:hypothetical protein